MIDLPFWMDVCFMSFHPYENSPLNDSYGLKNCSMIFWMGRLYDHHFVSQEPPPQRNRRNTWGSAPNPGYFAGFFLGDYIEYLSYVGIL